MANLICAFRYAFDLLQYIRAADDPVKQDVGLSSASVLIRQKAGIGREIGKIFAFFKCLVSKTGSNVGNR
jgi:hypothetical protein